MNTQTNTKANKFYQLIRRPQILALTGRSKSSLHLDEKAGLICPPISIGIRAVAYIKSEVEAVIQARIEGQSPEHIKELVKELIANRTTSNGGI
jgi:prophage regulatory protein